MRNQRGSTLPERAQLRELSVEEALVMHIQHTGDEIAPPSGRAVLLRAAKKNIAGKQREIRDEGSALPLDSLLTLREIKSDPEQQKVSGQRFLLTASDVGDPPREVHLRQCKEALRKNVRLTL